MLEDSRNVASVLSVDRAEIKVLVAEADKESVLPDGGGTIAENWPETFVRRRSKRFERRVIDESDTGGGRSEGQLGCLDADGFVDRREGAKEIARKMSLVMVPGEQDRLRRVRRSAEPKRAIDLWNNADQLVAQRAVQRARLRRDVTGEEQRQAHKTDQHPTLHLTSPLVQQNQRIPMLGLYFCSLFFVSG